MAVSLVPVVLARALAVTMAPGRGLMAAAPDPGEALRRTRARAAEWCVTDCEELCTHEIGDMLADLLLVLGLDGKEAP